MTAALLLPFIPPIGPLLPSHPLSSSRGSSHPRQLASPLRRRRTHAPSRPLPPSSPPPPIAARCTWSSRGATDRPSPPYKSGRPGDGRVRRRWRTAALSVALLTLPLISALRILPVPSLAPFLTSLPTRLAHLTPLHAALALAALNFCTVLFCFPANMALMIAAGALLGARCAFLALVLSKIAAACVAFVLARRVLQPRVQEWLRRRPRLARVLRDSAGGGWKFVLLMRLSPFPGFMLNYLLSITGVGFVEYALGTTLGILPSVLNLVLVGDAARDIGVGLGRGSVTGGWFALALRVVCIASMLVVTVLVTRRIRKAFQDADSALDVDVVDQST